MIRYAFCHMNLNLSIFVVDFEHISALLRHLRAADLQCKKSAKTFENFHVGRGIEQEVRRFTYRIV